MEKNAKHPIKRILLNADLGEGIGNDAALMPLIDLASIACGGHSGDADSMRAVVELALSHDVEIGAHPAYPDKQNFGRRSLRNEFTTAEIVSHCLEQIATLEQVCTEFGTSISYIKPHGALYHDLANDRELSIHFASACHAKNAKITMVGLANSQLDKATKQHSMNYLSEAFCDRRYNEDGTLVARSNIAKLPVLNSQEEVVTQLKCIAQGCVISSSGNQIALHADTVCLHSDTPSAVVLARAARAFLATLPPA